MTAPQDTPSDNPRPANPAPAGGRPPRIPSPAEPDRFVRRAESDPELWVTVAAELAE